MMNCEIPQGASKRESAGDVTRVLSGWKEIAAYLRRGVRTVQRWEKLGLPVRRPNAHLRSAVLTTVEEIDAWMQRCGDGRGERQSEAMNFEMLRGMIEQLRGENESLRKEIESLKRRGRGLQAAASDAGAGASSQVA